MNKSGRGYSSFLRTLVLTSVILFALAIGATSGGANSVAARSIPQVQPTTPHEPPEPDVERAREINFSALQDPSIEKTGHRAGPVVDSQMIDIVSPASQLIPPPIIVPSNESEGVISEEPLYESLTLKDESEGYGLTVPKGWKAIVNRKWDNTDSLKFDAIIGATSPDGETISLRVWKDVGTPANESLEIYLRPYIAPGVAINEGILRGTIAYLATRPGTTGQTPSSVYVFLQCQETAFRFEYISNAGGTQLESFIKLVESFWCGIDPSHSTNTDSETILPAISRSELVESPTTSTANPCQGYLDPNGNRYPCGQCTWWASYSRPDIPNAYGNEVYEWPSGNAQFWDDFARDHPQFSVSETPEPGSIAVWEANRDGATADGHVAYVTRVNGDGTFNVTDMNSDGKGSLKERSNITDTQNINFILGGVTFFEHINFEGQWYRLRANEPDLTYGGIAISSIFIPSGWDAIFYRDKNYNTASWRQRWGTTTLSALESSFWDLTKDNFSDSSNMNDNVRSAQVTKEACLVRPSRITPRYETNEGCGDPPPNENDTTPPSANGFSASVANGRYAEITTSGVQDNSGGSGVKEVRFSAKWAGNWYGIGTDSSAPYTLTWDMCSSGVSNGDVELGMEVWDNANNKWVWSEHYGNPHITKDSACGGSGDPQPGGEWHANFWMNKYLAGYVNWDVYYLWDDGKWPYIWFDWGINGPKEGWNGDEFSLRIWRNVYFPGGRYEFRTESDDGVRVYVDGQIVVDRWWDANSGAGGGKDISSGWHEVKVEYYENTGNARLYVYWYGPGYPQPDHENPGGRISSPIHLSAVNTSPLTIWAEAWDDASGVDFVRFMAHYCQGGQCGWHELGTDRNAPYNYSWNWSAIGEQHVWLAIHVADKTGKVTYDPGGWVEVDLDKTSPSAEIITPASGAYLTGSNVQISALAGDSGSGVGSVQFFAGYADGSGEYWHDLGFDTNGSDGWNKSWDVSSVNDQRDVSFFVYAYDRANNYMGTATWATVLDRGSPTSAVQGLPSTSPASFTVQWSGSDATSGVAGFDIDYQQDGGSWTRWRTGVTETSATFDGANGHTYGFRSRAIDMAGHVEAWPSSPDALTTVSVVQPPQSPVIIAPSYGTTFVEGEAITLSWQSVATATGYYGEISGGPTPMTFGWQSGTSVNIGAQWPGYEYYWRVKARNSGGEGGYTDKWLFTVVPKAPTNTSASALSCNSVKVTWTDNSNSEDGYKIYRDGVEVGSIGAGSTSYTDSVQAERTYTYAVKSHRNGIFSNAGSASVTTPKCPAQPPGVPTLQQPVHNATLERDGNLSFSWAAAQNANAYYVEFWGGPGIAINSGWQSAVSWNVGEMWGGSYRWRVKARTIEGTESAWSETRSLFVEYGPPKGLSSFVISAAHIYLSWEASADAPGNIDGYRIYRDGVAIATVNSSTVEYYDYGLNCGTTYRYLVRAYHGPDESDAGNAVTPATYPCDIAPSTIDPIKNADGDGNFEVSWSAAGTIESIYILEERLNGGGWQEILRAPEYRMTRANRTSGQWCYRIKVFDGNASSDWSNIACTRVQPVQGGSIRFFLPSVIGP